ncbi:S1 family peptidase [Streptomyces naphthomycinicus]|uniref:S1 family peptidase n=1 Tax=Streptomyces naphthomycinicus TaxID=2872625 RepID=UPI001CEC6F61|nr:trypsin-like serine protease [Streptomyces sp. TML10]
MSSRRRAVGAVFTFFAFLLAMAQPAAAIQGGTVSKHGPWAVRVYTDGEPSCTGTVVAPEWVITAGHCVRYDNWDVTFRVGSLDQRHGTVVHRVKNATVFAPTADVALVRVPRLKAEPIRLGGAGSVKTGRTVRSYGWGATCAPPKSEASCQSNVLKQAQVKIVASSDKRCDLLAGTGDFCVQRGSGLPAGGDSGGPATAFDKAGHEVLVGVLAASDRTAVAAFGDVTRLRAWIDGVIHAGSRGAGGS